MIDDKSIGERFADLRKSKKDNHGKDMPIIQLAQELLSEKYIKDYTVDIIRQEISKVEKGKFPQLFLIKGYCKYFKVTSDYLLGIRNTKPVDENIAMINKTTRLNDNSIYSIKKLSDMQIAILNELLTGDLMSTLLDTILRYVPFDYSTKSSKVDEKWGYDEWRIIKTMEQVLIDVYKNNKLCEAAQKYRKDIIAQKYGYKNAKDAVQNMKMPEPPQ